jgi:hypothetical protein
MLTVLGRPSQPQDRLMISNVHRNGCKLSWKASADDGGLPIEYVIEKFLVDANAWLVATSDFTNRPIDWY